MIRKVTSQVPLARLPRSLRAPPPRRPPPRPPPNLRTHRGKGKVRTLQKSPSRPPQLEKRKELAMAGSLHCLLLQMAAFPRCAKLKAAPLKRRSWPLRNLQEVERDQVAEKEVEETILTRSPGLRGSLSRLNWCPMTPLGRLQAPRLVGESTRRRTLTSSAPRSRRRHPGTGKRGGTLELG